MKIKISALLLMVSIFVPFGCSPLIAENSTKSESERSTDQRECRQIAQEDSLHGPQDYREATETSSYYGCLKHRGWIIHR